MAGEFVGRRVRTPAGHGRAVAFVDSPTYLVEMDEGPRLLVAPSSLSDETFDDYIAAVLADPGDSSRIAPAMTPDAAALCVLNAVWERIAALPSVDRDSVAALLHVRKAP